MKKVNWVIKKIGRKKIYETITKNKKDKEIWKWNEKDKKKRSNQRKKKVE